MKTRFLRDLEVSAIGYGCMGLTHGYGAAPERSESIRLIQSAYDMGCTFFDTAESYSAGENEKLVGEGIKTFRSHIVLATKLHLSGHEENVAAAVKSHLEASLKRLGTDYVDIYYHHRIEDDSRVEEVAGAMGELIKEGKIRGWGQSQASEQQVRRANAVTPLTAIQSEFSMMERMFEKDVIPACEELGIGFVPFSPLASGFLSGKYTKEQTYAGDDVRRVISRFAPENVERNQPLLDLLHALAQEKEATPAQISLAWMLHKKKFIVPIPGMRKVARMEENFGADSVSLSEEEYRRIEEELAKITVYGNRTDKDIAKLRTMK